jgi:hypothetical protein
VDRVFLATFILVQPPNRSRADERGGSLEPPPGATFVQADCRQIPNVAVHASEHLLDNVEGASKQFVASHAWRDGE